MKVIIIGGVAGGASCAARLRRLDENAEIIMFERGAYISYANCGLPYYIGDEIKNRKLLLVQTPKKMKAQFNIDVRIQSEVTSIDRENKQVVVKNLTSGDQYTESYDKLVISTGSSPIKPPIKGIDLENIFTLWTVPDTDDIKEFIEEKKPKSAVVVGAGFIGIEMAENLKFLGLDVSVAELDNQVIQPLDYDMAQYAHRELNEKGINLHLSDGVDFFSKTINGVEVTLKSGSKIDADIVLLAIGVRPNGELAKAAELKTNSRGGVIVDEYLRTSDKDIYAVGDVIEVKDFINNTPTMIPLAGPANKQGRMAADNICGAEEKYKGTQGTSIVKVFDLTVASTGHNEKMLKAQGKEIHKDYEVTMVGPKSHASYYPGALNMSIKLIFDKLGTILGAQVVGFEKVDKIIDVIAAVTRLGGTVYDLKELEHAYAPPYSSAKDPVNMAGFSAQNILSGSVANILPSELPDLDMDKYIILDVREEFEVFSGKIDGSLNVALSTIRERLSEIDKDKTIITYCAVGQRSYLGARILMQNGYTVRNLAGGFPAYTVYNSDYTIMCNINENKDLKGSLLELNNINIASKNSNEAVKTIDAVDTIKLNACGLQCPGPLLEVFEKMKQMKIGQVLEVRATDPGFPKDAEGWARNTGNTFIEAKKDGSEYIILISKGETKSPHDAGLISKSDLPDDKTMVVFSGELDKAIASFIIANGAAAMGKKVTMFFTFWGLNILRKPKKVKVKKGLMEKAFGAMMPRGVNKLGLSNMNMMGMGSVMMKIVMKKKNVATLTDLMSSAKKNGVEMIACTMSMDVLGITEEELIDDVIYAGVGTYLDASERSNMSLFI